MAGEGLWLRREDGSETGWWNVACDSPGSSERLELLSHLERTFALVEEVEAAPIWVAKLQGVREHTSLIDRRGPHLKPPRRDPTSCARAVPPSQGLGRSTGSLSELLALQSNPVCLGSSSSPAPVGAFGGLRAFGRGSGSRASPPILLRFGAGEKRLGLLLSDPEPVADLCDEVGHKGNYTPFCARELEPRRSFRS
jgi:hypothetical protein